MLSARRWPTAISPAQFANVTQLASVPGYLRKDMQADGSLHTYANGEINYTIRGVHAKVSVIWNFEAPAGAGDTHYSVMRGANCNLVIRQGAEQGYQPVLYIEPLATIDTTAFSTALERALPQVQAKYPGIGLKRVNGSWEVTVPASYHVGHEAHFGQVTEQFLRYVARRRAAGVGSAEHAGQVLHDDHGAGTRPRLTESRAARAAASRSLAPSVPRPAAGQPPVERALLRGAIGDAQIDPLERLRVSARSAVDTAHALGQRSHE